MGTFSFFFSHHLQTMEGGMVVTDDDDLYEYLLPLRAHGWIRDLPEQNSLLNKTGDDFEVRWLGSYQLLVRHMRNGCGFDGRGG